MHLGLGLILVAAGLAVGLLYSERLGLAIAAVGLLVLVF